MRALTLSLLAFGLAGAILPLPAQGPNDPNEGSRLEWDNTNSIYHLSWWSRTGRTYFIQQSDDLSLWTYVPRIEPGNDSLKEWGLTSDRDKCFVRLRYSDIPTDDPWNADFDGDHVGNQAELDQITDPFSAADTDGNRLPDDWEKFYFSHLGVDPNALAARGDGLTNLQAFQQSLNPNDFYNGQPPTLTIVSGNSQTGPPNALLSQAFVVWVGDSDYNALSNAPVVFTVTSGDGRLTASSGGQRVDHLTVRTDESGLASVFFQLPPTDQSTCQISASAGISQPAIFTTATDSNISADSHSSPFVPTDAIATINDDGSVDVSWVNHTDNETEIRIEKGHADGTWEVIGTVPPGSTSFHLPAP